MPYLLHQILDESSRCKPNGVALRFGAESLTYGELERRANQLAHTLLKCGVERGERVGIYLSKSLESAVAIYGILKAGACYVPLDPWAPEGRLRFVLQDCGIRHLVTSDSKRRMLNKVLGDACELKFLIGIRIATSQNVHCFSWNDIDTSGETTPPQVTLTENDSAYILFTSGTTGQPKGVVRDNGGHMVALKWSMKAIYDVDPGEVYWAASDVGWVVGHAPVDPFNMPDD